MTSTFTSVSGLGVTAPFGAGEAPHRRPVVAVINGSPSLVSRTGTLLDSLSKAIGSRVAITVQEFGAADLAGLPLVFSRDELPASAQEGLSTIESADLVIAGSPVYKGSYSGVFKHIVDLLDPDALAGTPVLLAATGGSQRHTLMVEHQLRPLFSFFQAEVNPIGVFASPEDFTHGVISSRDLLHRIERAADQAAVALAAQMRPAPLTGRGERPLAAVRHGVTTEHGQRLLG